MSESPDSGLPQILDDCLDRYLAGESASDCAQRYPQYADEVRDYLAAVEKLGLAHSYDPPPEAKERGRQRLLAEWEAMRRERQEQEDGPAESA